MTTLNLTVNGVEHTLDIPPNRFLAEVLRYDLGLTGTKIGCNEAECGACTVIVNGRSVDSCIFPAFKAAGAEVLTIEGVAENWRENGKWSRVNGQLTIVNEATTSSGAIAGQAQLTIDNSQFTIDNLHPLQEAFVAHGATQCGFCTPGFIMQAKTLLDRTDEPTDEEIKHCLKDTYCRCTGYASILASVKAAAEKMRTGHLPPPELPEVAEPLAQIGPPLPRPDAVDKVTGRALYTDDYAFPGMLHGATLRSAHPHARILRIDAAAARALPGVHAVLTHEDVPGDPRHGLVEQDWPVFAGGGYPARYVGDPIALVVAERNELAHEALGHIQVEYEVLPAVTDPVAARQPDAPVLHPDRPTGNLLKHIKVRHGDVDAGFRRGGRHRRAHLPHADDRARLPGTGMRGRRAGRLGRSPHGRHEKLTVYVGSQIPYADRHQVAECLGLAEEQVRVHGAVMGGGFGGKEDIAGQMHAALAAQVTGRPVKVLYTREESLRFHPKRHATMIRVKTGATRDGTITAVEAELYGDSGAYASLGEKVMTRATTHATGPYAVAQRQDRLLRHVHQQRPVRRVPRLRRHAVRLCRREQHGHPGPRAGHGPRRAAAQERPARRRRHRHRPAPARQHGADGVPGEGRRQHETFQDEEQWPGGDGPISPDSLFSPFRVGSRMYAWGLAAGYKNTGLGGGAPDKAEAEVEVYTDGTAEIRTSSAEMGQNLVGVLAACTAEELGLPYGDVARPGDGHRPHARRRPHHGQPPDLRQRQRRPPGRPHHARAHPGRAGGEVRRAARGRRLPRGPGLRRRAAPAPGAERRDGKRHGRRTGHSLPLVRPGGADAPRRGALAAAALRILGAQDAAPGHGRRHARSLLATRCTPRWWAWTWRPARCAVERVVTAHDVGRAINPLSLTGQIEGGVVMGLGNALTEHYIEENGVPWTQHLGQYKMPGIKHTPEMEHFIVEDRRPTGLTAPRA